MINGVVRSPTSFFDSTPSGVLANKFSNDLGILDNSLPMVLTDTLEGPTSMAVAIVNICIIYPFFIPPAVVILACGIIFLFYARPAFAQCRQLDLANKNPIFHAYSETIGGLTQIKIYNRRR
jgi:ABC-type multidrug transport system fused ATPase/permease subunit